MQIFTSQPLYISIQDVISSIVMTMHFLTALTTYSFWIMIRYPVGITFDIVINDFVIGVTASLRITLESIVNRGLGMGTLLSHTTTSTIMTLTCFK